MFRSRLALLALLLSPFASISPAEAHGSHGGSGEALEAGEFDFSPLVVIEGGGGFDINLEDSPKHYSLGGSLGGVFTWGLGNGANLSIEASIGPSLVWGEAEHFYGKVHAQDHDDHDHKDDHDDDHDHKDDHDDHDHKDDHEHEHEHAHDTDYKRTDIRGFLQIKYAPSDRLDFAISWMPHYVTKDQGDDIKGLKNELRAKMTWAFGDGDVDFALGDSFSDLIDGIFVSLDHRQGWESDGMWVGNYTDPRLGLGFKYDKLNVRLDGGPRLYVPGSYSGLDQRTDFAAELSLSYELSEKAELFAQWQQTYSWEDAPGWGEGWQHHIHTGVAFSF